VGEALNLNEEITSPTYPIVNEYSSRPALIHMDLYRLHGLEDFENMGGLEYFNLNNICLIEWPQRALEAIPWTKRIEIAILEEDKRRITLEELDA
jgi:tRNA threonylcarbamoyladenosine biosynthesis protein TsaE